MSIFQNALAMGSRLNLGNMNSNNNSSSSSSSPKTKSSSSGGKFLSRNMSTKSSKVQNMKQSQSQSQSPMIGSPLSVSSAAAVTPKGSPALFGASRQREKRSNSSTPTPTPSTPSNPNFIVDLASPITSSPPTISPRSHSQSSPYTTQSSPTPRSSVGPPPSPSAKSSSSPTLKKSMFNLKNFSATNLMHGVRGGNGKSSVQSHSPSPSPLMGLGVQGYFEGAGMRESRIIKGQERSIGPMISQRQESLHPGRIAPMHSIFTTYDNNQLSRVESNDTYYSSQAEEESGSDDEFTSYRYSMAADFPVPPPFNFAIPEEAEAEESEGAVVAVPTPTMTSTTLSDLKALKAETAKMYNLASTGSTLQLAQLPSTSSARKAVRKAVPQWLAATEVSATPMTFPSFGVEEYPTPPASKPFYVNVRASQSVMTFGSHPSSSPSSPSPSRLESFSANLIANNLILPSQSIQQRITRKAVPQPIRVHSHGSFSSSSSNSDDSENVPPLTSSSTSTKSSSRSSSSYTDSAPTTPCDFVSSSPVVGGFSHGDRLFAPQAPNAPYLRKPVYALEVATLDHNEEEEESYGGIKTVVISPPTSPRMEMAKKEKKRGLWSKTMKALKA